MKHFKLFLALGILLILSSPAWADIPKLINFQGILDSAGNPLANRTVSVEFRIYNAPAGGTAYWSETQSVTTNAGGVFNVILGTSNPIPDSAFDDTLRWLGIKVGTDAEMSPRQQIVSNAYGYRVSTVDGAKGGVISGDVDIQSDLTVSGNVGIGTGSPLSQLHLESSNPISEGMRIYNTSATGDPAISFLTDGVFQYTLGVDNDDGDKFQISAGSTLNSSELLTLTSTGNVGIGTTSPSSKLDVNLGTTDAKFTGFGTNNTGLNLINTDVTSRTWALWALGNSGLGGPAKGFAIADVTIPATRLVIDVAGNVGIGTTSPLNKLTVYDDNTVEYGLRVDKVATAGNSQAISALNSAVPGTGFASHGGFFSANANASGIGSKKVGVRGQALGTGDDNMAGWFQASGATNNYAIYADLGKNYFADNVGIGTASPGNILTVVASSVTDPIADAWTTYSSAEYKQGIHELTDEEYSDALQKLLATPVVKYRYKGQSFMDKEKIGIVIEEAPEEIVSEGNAKAASLSEYISLLHAGLKAQQNQIESQQIQIKKLEETVNQLTKEE